MKAGGKGKIYGIGGLGVDERVFAELQLDFELIPLRWIEHEPGETIESYARRFLNQIDRGAPFSIIGISFGGMMAIELSKISDPTQIVLISSATGKSDIPLLFRVFGKLGLLSLIPTFMLKPPAFIANFFFGVSETRYKKCLKEILADTNTAFLRWATQEISRWDNSHRPGNMTRIHGSSDRILRCSNEERTITILEAGHFMVMNRAKEVSAILNQTMSVPR